MQHPGIKETNKKVGDRYYWPEMKREITNFVQHCMPCQLSKPQPKIRPPLDPIPVAAPRFQDLQLDLVGPLPVSNGFNHILTIVCRTTRWLQAVPLQGATAAAVCDAFEENWIPMFGVPAKARTDNGVSFTSRLWTDLNSRINTIVAYSPLYSPQSVGLVERQHGTLKNSMRAVLHQMGDYYGSKWSRILPWILLARRTSYHEDLGATPAELVLGENPRLPGEMIPPLKAGEPLPELLARLKENAARPPSQTNLRRQTKVYMPESTETATHVLTEKAKKTPLSTIFDGPFPITDKLGKSCLKLQTGTFKTGAPRSEVRHWNTCVPAKMAPNSKSADPPHWAENH